MGNGKRQRRKRKILCRLTRARKNLPHIDGIGGNQGAVLLIEKLPSRYKTPVVDRVRYQAKRLWKEEAGEWHCGKKGRDLFKKV